MFVEIMDKSCEEKLVEQQSETEDVPVTSVSRALTG
jgi:hypothetical protein